MQRYRTNFTAPPFNIKNVLFLFKKPAGILHQYSVDTLFFVSLLFRAAPSTLPSCTWHHLRCHLFTTTFVVVNRSLKPLFFYRILAYGRVSVMVTALCSRRWMCMACRPGMVLIKYKALHKVLLTSDISKWVSKTWWLPSLSHLQLVKSWQGAHWNGSHGIQMLEQILFSLDCMGKLRGISFLSDLYYFLLAPTVSQEIHTADTAISLRGFLKWQENGTALKSVNFWDSLWIVTMVVLSHEIHTKLVISFFGCWHSNCMSNTALTHGMLWNMLSNNAHFGHGDFIQSFILPLLFFIWKEVRIWSSWINL